jgi:hypothetical protein
MSGPAAAGAGARPLGGPGEMADRIRAHPWHETPIGPIEDWPEQLSTSIEVCLASPFPTMIVWGPTHIQLYNDALVPILGGKHPAALGRPYGESFQEIWDVQGPMLWALYERGDPSFQEDMPIRFERAGLMEDMFFTFSWSPIPDRSGDIGGALHVVHETTRQVIAERRIRLLREVAVDVGGARDAVGAARRALDVVARHGADDVPFAEVRLTGFDGGTATVATVGQPPVDLASVEVLPGLLDGGTRRARVELAPGRSDGNAVRRLVGVPFPRAGDSGGRGALVVGVHPHLPLDEAYLEFLDLLASQVASHCSSAAAFDAQRRAALTLQESLLPYVEVVSGLEVAARYRPGEAGAKVGGDWFEVIGLGGGRTALVVGDVMGHGVQAAAVMGQLRGALRAYAHLGMAPEDVLANLDRLLEGIAGNRADAIIVTCTYAVHDASTGEVLYANAGHPSAIVVDPHGVGRAVLSPASPPLGVGGVTFDRQHLELSPGSTLVLYTDGVVESRAESIDVGIERLARWAGQLAGPLEAMADELMGRSLEMTGGGDDAALLLVRPT